KVHCTSRRARCAEGMVVSLQPCVLIACATYTATSADRDMQVRAFNPAATGGPQRPSTRGSRVLMSDYLRPCGDGADHCRGTALEHYRPTPMLERSPSVRSRVQR